MIRKSDIPIACTLSKSEQARAAETYRAGLFKHVVEVRKRADGVSLRFAWSDERIHEIGEFLAIETSCCSFLDHTLEVPRGKESIWLHFSGPTDAQGPLLSEMRELVPQGMAFEESDKQENKTNTPKSWIARTGVGLTSLGLLSIACCVAPALGLSALVATGAGLGMLLDPLAVVSLALGVALLACWQAHRSKKRCSPGC